jgi:DNA polymerase III delta prime subunit
MMVFAGTCTTCGKTQTWHSLSQELPCLEAKNNGIFGECETGVFVEEHGFDQECDRCSEEDEGLGDVDYQQRERDKGRDKEMERERDKKKRKKK